MKLKITFLCLVFLSLTFCKSDPRGRGGSDAFDKAAFKAAFEGDLASLQAAHKEGANLNYQNSKNKDSALLLAVLYDEADSHKDVIEYLRQNGARDDLENKVKLTAKEIEEGKKEGKFLQTIRSGANFFKLPEDCVSLKSYAEQDGKFYKKGDTKPLGKGSQGTAFLVYKRSDWSLWAPKFPNTALEQGAAYVDVNEKHIKEFKRDDRDVMLSMKYGFGNPVEVKVGLTEGSTSEDPIGGIPYAMKSGITGGTLKAAIESGLFFAKKEEDVNGSAEKLKRAQAMRKDLPELFMRMAWGKKAYADLNPDNLMWKYDDPNVKTGGQWVVIDAKAPNGIPENDDGTTPPNLYPYQVAWKKNFDYFLEKLPILAAPPFHVVLNIVSKQVLNTIKTWLTGEWKYEAYETYRGRVQAKIIDRSLYLPKIRTSEYFTSLHGILKKIQDNPPVAEPPLGTPTELADILLENQWVSFEELVQKSEAYDVYRKVLMREKESHFEPLKEALSKKLGVAEDDQRVVGVINRALEKRKKIFMLP